MSRNGRLVTWSGGGAVSTYDAVSGRLLASRLGVAHGAASATGVVALASAQGRLAFVDGRELSPLGPPVPGSVGRTQQLGFSRDGSLLAVHGGDGGVRLFDVASRLQLGERFDLGSEHARSMALRPDGLALALPHPDGVLVWDLRAGAARRTACALAARRLTDQEIASYLAGVSGAGLGCAV